MDQLRVLFDKLNELYSYLAGVVAVVGGAVMVCLLAMAIYRYVAGSQKLSALVDDALEAATAGLSLWLAAGVLNGQLFPAQGWPFQLGGMLLALYTVKVLRK